MTVTNLPSSAFLDTVNSQDANQAELGVAVLKKMQDQMKQQGDAMVKLIEQAGSQDDRHLDVYA